MQQEQQMVMLQEMSLLQRIAWVLFESNFELAEYLFAIPLFGFTVTLLLVPDAFLHSIGLKLLDPIQPEILVFCATMFLLKVISAIFRWTMVHAVILFVISIWWLLVAVIVCKYNPLGLGTSLFGSLCLGQIICCVRFARQHDFRLWRRHAP